MKTNKNLSTPIMWGITSVIAGLVLVIFNESILKWLFILFGAALVVIGIVPVIQAWSKKSPIPTLSILYAVVGILVMVLNTALSAVLVLALGIVLLLAGLQNITSLIQLKRGFDIRVPFSHYIVPALCVICGIVAICNPFEAQTSLIIFIGCCILVQGVSNLISLLTLYRRNKSVFQATNAKSADNITDATIIEDAK